MVPRATGAFDHLRHPRQGPEFGAKPVGARALAERLIEGPSLGFGQLGFAAGATSGAQSGDSVPLPVGKPATGALAADVKLGGDESL